PETLAMASGDEVGGRVRHSSVAKPVGIGGVAGPGTQRYSVQRPLGGLQRMAGPVRKAVVLGALETQLGGPGRAWRNSKKDRRALPGDSDARLCDVAPVPRRRLHARGTHRVGGATHRRHGRRPRGRLVLSRRENTALLRALGRREMGLVDVRGFRGRGADEQSWRAGAATGGLMATPIIRLS